MNAPLRVIDERWYPVVGCTAADLVLAVRTLGPARSGRVFAAFTDWSIAWRWEAAAQRGGVGIASYEIDVRVTMTLPRWIPLRGTPDDLIRRWSAFVEALRRHEQGHVALALAAAEGVGAELRAFGPHSGTDALGRAVEAAANGSVARARAAERRYDALTGDGEKQGASVDHLGSQVAVGGAFL
jgi:predicted secreted Zn-dependent protease